jgi:integrase
LLDWAGPTRLTDGETIEPCFTAYLLTARNDGSEKELAPSMLRRICMGSRMFFLWAKQQFPHYSNVPDAWIQAIRPTKALMQPKIGEHQFWKLEDVLKIARYPVDTLHDRRAQSAICFLYLSGMRISAFVTLPLNCVDIQNRRVEQNPDKGVMTKNQKAAITTLLPILELIHVAAEWDALVRSSLPAATPWFVYIDNADRLKNPVGDVRKQVNGRRMAVVEGMKRLCALAGVPYLSPHKLRHGHAIYGIKHARNMRELKAVSQNLMHSSISITDGIYGNLNNDDLAQTIASLVCNSEQLTDEVIIRRVLDVLQSIPGLFQRV